MKHYLCEYLGLLEIIIVGMYKEVLSAIIIFIIGNQLVTWILG